MKAFRAARALAALFALLSALAPARAAPCPNLPAGVSVDQVLVSIASNGEARPYLATIRGVLHSPPGLADAALRGISRGRLCAAAVGQLSVDNTPLCLDSDPSFSSLDRVTRVDAQVNFELGTEVPRSRDADSVALTHTESASRCAPRATFLVAAGAGEDVTGVPILPDRISRGAISWTETDWGPGAAGMLRIGLQPQRPPAAPGTADEQRMNPPPSWSHYARGEGFDRLADLLWVMFFVAVVLGAFMHFGHGLLFAEAPPPLAVVVRALTAALILYAATRMTTLSLELARLTLNARVADFDIAATGLDYHQVRILVATGLLLPLVALLWTASLIAGPPAKRGSILRHSGRLILRTLAQGSLFALLALALAAIAAQLLPLATPYEPVELAVSLFLAGWALWSFAPVTGFNFKWNALAAIILTMMLLSPQPVLRSSGETPSAVDNALVWFPVAGGYFIQKVMLLTVALAAALKIARSKSRKCDEIGECRTMFFLFGFSVSLGAINNLSSVLLVLGVLVAADRLLFPRDAPAPETDQSGTDRDRPARTFAPGPLALGVGLIAVAVFWLQHSTDVLGRDDALPGLMVPALLVYSAAVPAAIGGLLLQHSFVRIPGPIAAGKALILTGFAFAVAVATRLPIIIAQHTILPAVIDILGIFTALVITAIIVYDGPQARTSLDGKTLSDRLGGSGFGWLLTILSSVALAIASAMGPVVYGDLGNVFRSVLDDTLVSARAGGAPAVEPGVDQRYR